MLSDQLQLKDHVNIKFLKLFFMVYPEIEDISELLDLSSSTSSKYLNEEYIESLINDSNPMKPYFRDIFQNYILCNFIKQKNQKIFADKTENFQLLNLKNYESVMNIRVNEIEEIAEKTKFYWNSHSSHFYRNTNMEKQINYFLEMTPLEMEQNVTQYYFESDIVIGGILGIESCGSPHNKFLVLDFPDSDCPLNSLSFHPYQLRNFQKNEFVADCSNLEKLEHFLEKLNIILQQVEGILEDPDALITSEKVKNENFNSLINRWVRSTNLKSLQVKIGIRLSRR